MLHISSQTCDLITTTSSPASYFLPGSPESQSLGHIPCSVGNNGSELADLDNLFIDPALSLPTNGGASSSSWWTGSDAVTPPYSFSSSPIHPGQFPSDPPTTTFQALSDDNSSPSTPIPQQQQPQRQEDGAGDAARTNGAQSRRFSTRTRQFTPLSDEEPSRRNSVSEALFLAATHGHVGVVRALCEAGADLDAVDGDGNSALHLAVVGKHLDVISVLLKHSAQPQLHNSNDLTPL